MQWQSLLRGVEARSFASPADGPLGAAPERKRTRGTRAAGQQSKSRVQQPVSYCSAQIRKADIQQARQPSPEGVRRWSACDKS